MRVKKEFLQTVSKVGLVTVCSFVLGISGSLWSGAGTTDFVRAAEETTETPALPKAPVMSVSGTGKEAVTGCYENAFDLALTAETGLKIYYTLDGSDPTNAGNANRKEYTESFTVTDRKEDENYIAAVDPVRFDNNSSNAKWNRTENKLEDKYGAPAKEDVDKATVVRAAAYDAATGTYSLVATNTYFVGAITEHISGIADSAKAAGVPLSILSISTDFDNLYDEEKGIYVRGKMFWDAAEAMGLSRSIVNQVEGLPANFSQRGKEWERPAHIDYMESDGTTVEVKLQQDCGIRIQGNYSRRDLQKSFRLYARKEYGDGKKNFEYNFFGDAAKDYKGNTLGKYKKLVAHTGGNSAFWAKYQNTYWQTLFAGLSCDVQASRACVVYVDGEYHGLYILQEDLGDDYAEKHHGIDKEAYGIVSYKGDHEKNPDTGYEIDDGEDYLPEGEDATYFMKDLMNFFATHKSCISQRDYDALAKIVDPDTCMDYFAAEFWINNKWDWPGKNWYMWRTTRTPENADTSNPYADGRWRFALCDMDFGGWSGQSEAGDNTLTKEKDFLNLDYEQTVEKNAGVVIVKTFAYFMSNDAFRSRFVSRLEEIAADIAGVEKASALLTKIADTYDPLYEQFYIRYYSNPTDQRAQTVDGAVQGAKEVRGILSGFINQRGNILSAFKETIEAKAATYKDLDPEGYAQMLKEQGQTSGDDDKTTEPAATAIKLSAKVKSGKKKLVISTTKKAKLTVKFSKKVSYKSGKKVKKIKKLTIKAAKTKTGKVTLSFKKKLPKKLKITIKAQKGKKTKTVKLTVK